MNFNPFKPKPQWSKQEYQKTREQVKKRVTPQVKMLMTINLLCIIVFVISLILLLFGDVTSQVLTIMVLCFVIGILSWVMMMKILTRRN